MFNELASRRLIIASIWFTSIGLALYAFFFEPGKTGFFPGCMFRLLTGFTCPGCGSTRALHQLLHGHLGDAFVLNPLLLIVLPILLFVLIRHTSWAISGATPKRNRMPAPMIYGIFFLLVSFWVIRNTSIYPFVS
jgi:Protein of unknown function (DUF2752)